MAKHHRRHRIVQRPRGADRAAEGEHPHVGRHARPQPADVVAGTTARYAEAGIAAAIAVYYLIEGWLYDIPGGIAAL